MIRIAVLLDLVGAGLAAGLSAQVRPAEPAPPPAPAPTPAAIDSIFAPYDRTSGPGCALGVYRDGGIVYTRGYGMADLNQGIAISPRTVFYIASTSKQFTAFAIALLAERGRIGLDDPVRKYVPELPGYADSVTVSDLVHHTSGIRDYLGIWDLSGRSYADLIPEEQVLELLGRQRALNFEPGTAWSYSNSGYFLLALIVERVTGKSLRQFTTDEIFAPLGMADTHFHDDGTMVVRRRAEGYQPDGRGGYEIVRTSFALVGDGGLLTTVLDLARWDENFYRNRLGTGGQAIVERVTTPGRLTSGEPLDYGFGLFRTDYRGLPVVRHGGSFIGFRAALTRFPTEHFSVAVLCNDDTADADGLAYRVADRYLASRLAAPVRASAPAGVTVAQAHLDRLVGRYEVQPGLVVAVVREGDRLAARVMGGPSMPLTATSDSTFTPAGFPGELRFVGGAGPAPGLIVTAMGAREPGPRLPDPPELTAAAAGAYAGRYRSDELDTWYTIRAGPGGIEVRRRYGAWAALQPLRRDEFAGAGAKLVFARDGRGRVTGFGLSAARVLGVRFRKDGR